MMEIARELLPAILSGIACGLVAWGGMRSDLNHVRREAIRAHKRLDLVNAPSLTLDEHY